MDNKLNEALVMYDLKSPKACLIRHNENVTYKVIDGDKAYVLRIHQPADGFSLKMIHAGFDRLDLIKSEMEIISDLADNTGISLQHPVHNRDGNVVSILACGTPATLLEWVEGETL